MDLIVKATDPNRPEQVPANGVPKLTAMDYKEAAKPKTPSPPTKKK